MYFWISLLVKNEGLRDSSEHSSYHTTGRVDPDLAFPHHVAHEEAVCNTRSATEGLQRGGLGLDALAPHPIGISCAPRTRSGPGTISAGTRRSRCGRVLVVCHRPNQPRRVRDRDHNEKTDREVCSVYRVLTSERQKKARRERYRQHGQVVLQQPTRRLKRRRNVCFPSLIEKRCTVTIFRCRLLGGRIREMIHAGERQPSE